MTVPTRDDLERAAIAFFGKMILDVDQPRTFSDYHPDDALSFNIKQSRLRIAELDDQLKANVFDEAVIAGAETLTGAGSGHDITERERLYARQLSARAEREKYEFLIHQLTSPARPYRVYDGFFDNEKLRKIGTGLLADPSVVVGPTLAQMAILYLNMKRDQQHVKSQLEDASRVLRWLAERVGSETPLRSISKQDLRTFRDDLTRLAKAKKGQATAFEERLTNVAFERVVPATASRYWGFVRSYFRWSAAEGYIDSDPTAHLSMQTPKNIQKKSPEAFSTVELQDLFKTPLYAGHLPKRWATPGHSFRRDGKWWSAVVLMYSGMRGGELAQLEPSDFVLDAEIPFIHVRPEGENGKQTKSVKNAASVRQVPIASVLLELGLAEFVMAKRTAKHTRVFDDFRLGKGRSSDGISKFWSRYLRQVDLWKAGRSTHVWRHTFVACLRENGVPQEDIAAVVGHEQGTITSGYGGAYSLSRKKKTLDVLNYGFDVLTALGGPYDKTRHG